jgi:hypothetical protein
MAVTCADSPSEARAVLTSVPTLEHHQIWQLARRGLSVVSGFRSPGSRRRGAATRASAIGEGGANLKGSERVALAYLKVRSGVPRFGSPFAVDAPGPCSRARGSLTRRVCVTSRERVPDRLRHLWASSATCAPRVGSCTSCASSAMYPPDVPAPLDTAFCTSYAHPDRPSNPAASWARGTKEEGKPCADVFVALLWQSPPP